MKDEIIVFIRDLREKGLSFREIAKQIEEHFSVKYSVNYLRKIYFKKLKNLSSEQVEGITYVRFTANDSELSIIPVADLHLKTKEEAEKALAEIKKVADKKTYFLFLGDIIQLDIAKPANVFNSNPMQNLEALLFFADALKGKTIAIVTGNHEDRLNRQAGVDISALISSLFGIPYASSSALIDICFNDARKTIYALHGTTAAQRVGGKLNRLEDLERVCDADIYLQAHTHLPAIFYRDRFFSNGYGIRRKKLLFVSVPSLQNYEPYAAKRGYAPFPKQLFKISLNQYEASVHPVYASAEAYEDFQKII